MKPNILVASHKRSGTHLLIDLLRNNAVDYKAWYLTTSGLLRRESSTRAKYSILYRAEKTPRVIKTHLDASSYIELLNESSIARRFLSGAKILYAHRNGLDVLASQYARDILSQEREKITPIEYLQQVLPINGAYLTRPQYWKKHTEEWLSLCNVIPVCFEQLITDPKTCLERISEELSIDLREEFVDVRLRSIPNEIVRFNSRNQLSDGVSRTSVAFRRGQIGDGLTVFHAEGKKYFDECVLRPPSG